MRFLAVVRWATKRQRRRTRSRSSRMSGGGAQASGTRSVRSRWARILASILSVFTRAEAIALTCEGWASFTCAPVAQRAS